MISLRRLRWIACCALLVCLLWLTPGSRMAIHRFLVRSWLGPEVSVGQLIVHQRHNLLEASQLQWTGARGARRFEIAAEHGWLAVDRAELLSGHASFPQLVLRSADVRLEQTTSDSEDVLVAWKRRIAQHLSQLDWGQLQRNLTSLGAAQEFTRSVGDRVERWIARSREIVAEVEKLEQQVASMDNPLRFEDSVQEKLSRIQELSLEQNLLANQFDDLPEQVAAGKADLKKLFDQDRTRLVGLVTGAESANTVQLERDRLCNELAAELALGFSQQLLPYGEIVDLIATVSRTQSRPAYDLDFPAATADTNWFAVPRWKAAGNFCFGDRQTPYQASGNWFRATDSLGAATTRLAWEVHFQPAGRYHTVRVEHAATESNETQVHIIDSATSPTAVASDRELPMIEQAPASSSLSLISTDGQIRGRLSLHAHSLIWLSGQTNWSQPAAEAADVPPLLFELSGDWQIVTIRPVDALPAWFVQAVKADLDQRLQLALRGNSEQLQRTFEQHLLQLQAAVDGALQQSQPLARKHTQQLMAARDRLLQQFTDAHGDTQFARQPGALIR